MEQGSEHEPASSRSVIGRFWHELRRRKVIRVASAYIVTGWIIIQVASSTFADFGIPVWAFRFVVLMVGLGLPLAIILAWAFELTPDGIRSTRRTEDRTGDDEDEGHHRKRNWFAYGVGAVLPTLIFGALAVYFYIQSGTHADKLELIEEDAVSAQEEAINKSIAVLPLDNLSPDQENAFFASGIQEDVLTNLAKIVDLRVISRSSTMKYTDPDRDLKQVGKELGVRYLVEGSVRRVGQQVRVTIQLIDALTDEHLWAENYDRTLEDVFAMQSAIAKEIAKQLKANVSPEEIARIEEKPTTSTVAYDYFLKFRQLQDEFGPTMGDEKIALLEKAVQEDPNYVEAWAQLAVECVWWWNVGKFRNDQKMLLRGYQAMDKAQRLDPNHPHLYFARASFAEHFTRDRESLVFYYEEALKVDPAYEIAHSRLGRLFLIRGDLDRAEVHLREAAARNPNADITYMNMLTLLRRQGKWEEARNWIKGNRSDGFNALVFDRFHSRAYEKLDLLTLEYVRTGNPKPYLDGLAELDREVGGSNSVFLNSALGRSERAIELLEKGGSTSSLAYYWGDLIAVSDLQIAWIHMREGRMEMAKKKAGQAVIVIEELIAKNPQNIDRFRAGLAGAKALLGENEEVRELMAEAEAALDSYPPSRIRFEINYATICLAMGEMEEAIDHLEKAVNCDVPWNVVREEFIPFTFSILNGNLRYEALIEGTQRVELE